MLPAFQARAEQTYAHAVGAGIHLPVAVERIEQAHGREVADLRAEDQLQARFAGAVHDPFAGQGQRARSRAIGQPAEAVACGQGLAVGAGAAQAFAGHRGQAAQLALAGEAAGRRQVGAGALARVGEGQALAVAHGERAPGRQRLAIEGRAEIAAGQGQPAVGVAFGDETAEGDLDHRGVQGIAQQPVGPAHGQPVEGAALGHAEMAAAEAAAILQLDQRGALAHPQSAVDGVVHAWTSRGVSSPPRRTNSACPMGSKRTRSPARSRL